jgi:hypothetical protein
MDIQIAGAIIIIILIIGFIYAPDFFTTELIATIAAIFILVWILIDDEMQTNIVGGNESQPYMKMDLMDPKHNFREIAKQLILLEDHMAHKSKRCIDCITKHYLMVEGLLEEAITLDKTGEHTEEARNITDKIKPAVMKIIELIKNDQIKDADYTAACQVLREERKKIALKYVLNV